MFRRIEKKDREIYLALAREFYHSPAVLHSVPESYLEKAFDEMVHSDVYLEGYLLNDGTDCGYALLAKSFSQEAGGLAVWLDEFYVRETSRGKGLGREFLHYLTEQYANAARLRLETEPDNAKAEKLYRSLGFKPLVYKQFVREKNEE